MQEGGTQASRLPTGPNRPSGEARGWPDQMPLNIHVTNQLPLFCLAPHQAIFWEFGWEDCLSGLRVQAQGPGCLVPLVVLVVVISEPTGILIVMRLPTGLACLGESLLAKAPVALTVQVLAQTHKGSSRDMQWRHAWVPKKSFLGP